MGQLGQSKRLDGATGSRIIKVARAVISLRSCTGTRRKFRCEPHSFKPKIKLASKPQLFWQASERVAIVVSHFVPLGLSRPSTRESRLYRAHILLPGFKLNCKPCAESSFSCCTQQMNKIQNITFSLFQIEIFNLLARGLLFQ